jgi:CHAD domain-containing protein
VLSLSTTGPLLHSFCLALQELRQVVVNFQTYIVAVKDPPNRIGSTVGAAGFVAEDVRDLAMLRSARPHFPPSERRIAIRPRPQPRRDVLERIHLGRKTVQRANKNHVRGFRWHASTVDTVCHRQ